jgi:hypothetical protein
MEEGQQPSLKIKSVPEMGSGLSALNGKEGEKMFEHFWKFPNWLKFE